MTTGSRWAATSVAMGLFAAATLAGCEGPSVPSLVKDEPTCADFKLAGAEMKGGLKRPVRMRVLEGTKLIATVMLYGVPSSSKQPTRFLLPDADAEYTVEWGQCANERAPTGTDPRESNRAAKKADAGFQCGEVAVYSTEQKSGKKGDPSTHEFVMPAPPVADCWTPPVAEAPSASAAVSASAAASASAASSASAAATSSEEDVAPSASASASAAPSAAASAAPSASAAASAKPKN